MNKHKNLLDGIVFKALPIFSDSKMQEAINQLIYTYPNAINVEYLIEESLAKKGGYNFVDESGRDFDCQDNSDSKTATVNVKTRKVEISGMGNKYGSTRISISNDLAVYEKISYLYIPAAWLPLVLNKCYGVNAADKRLIITWKKERPKKYPHTYREGYFCKFEKFRVDSFEELAQMTDQKFYELYPHLVLTESLPELHSIELSRTDPIQEISIPYIPAIDQLQIQEMLVPQPSVLSEKS